VNFEELKAGLKEGHSLSVKTGGGTFEVWAEPYANPPSVYYEGQQFPISELDRIVQTILDNLAAEEIQIRWVKDD
jgi:hypothetical protein